MDNTFEENRKRLTQDDYIQIKQIYSRSFKQIQTALVCSYKSYSLTGEFRSPLAKEWFWADANQPLQDAGIGAFARAKRLILYHIAQEPSFREVPILKKLPEKPTTYSEYGNRTFEELKATLPPGFSFCFDSEGKPLYRPVHDDELFLVATTGGDVMRAGQNRFIDDPWLTYPHLIVQEDFRPTYSDRIPRCPEEYKFVIGFTKYSIPFKTFRIPRMGEWYLSVWNIPLQNAGDLICPRLILEKIPTPTLKRIRVIYEAEKEKRQAMQGEQYLSSTGNLLTRMGPEKTKCPVTVYHQISKEFID